MTARGGDEAALDAWMERLADGDRAAFEPLFRALHPRALRLARARLGDDAAAADAAQATMMKVFARASDFARGAAVLPWFYAVAANEVRAAQRKRRAHEPIDAAGDLGGEDDPERDLLARELRAALDGAIAALDAGSADAIAAMLGRGARPPIDDATFRKRVSRAYARLRVLLAGEQGGRR